MKRKVEGNTEELAWHEERKTLQEERKTLQEERKTLQEERKKLQESLRTRVECPVCYEVPTTGPLPVCLNGHIVCRKCNR